MKSVGREKDEPKARDMCSASVYTPTLVMIPEATRTETKIPCQNEKKRIPLTQRNLGVGRKGLTLRLRREVETRQSEKRRLERKRRRLTLRESRPRTLRGSCRTKVEDLSPRYGKIAENLDSLERETDRDVVDDGDVGVGSGEGELSVGVGISELEYQSDESEDRLDPDVF